MFEGVECKLACRGPVPGGVCREEWVEGQADLGKVRNVVAVELGKTEERAKVVDIFGRLPVIDGLGFLSLDGDTLFGDGEAEVIELSLKEFGFFGNLCEFLRVRAG